MAPYKLSYYNLSATETVAMGGATVLRVGYKIMLRTEQVDFFLFEPAHHAHDCDTPGYISRNRGQQKCDK